MSTRRVSPGPFLFGPFRDALVFGGSAAAGLVLVALRGALGIGRELPEWGFVAFVVAVDVAHVYATLFRTYFDRAEVSRNLGRYVGLPAAAYAGLVALYSAGSIVFWRALAYLAVFHFVRQQAGWVALYRARSERRGVAERLVDEGAVYAATLYPLVHWHARLPRTDFAWFVRGDFFDAASAAERLLPFARAAYVVLLSAFAVREVVRAITVRRVEAGKTLVVAATAATWYVGIVATNSDFDFTVTNVLAHGVPYLVLLYSYARAQHREGHGSLGADVAACGFGAFFGVVALLAFVEEGLWDRLVFHDHPGLFGGGGSEAPVSGRVEALVVAALALPQVVHYLLDGVLWRRSEPAARWLSAALRGGRAGERSALRAERRSSASKPHLPPLVKS